LRFYSNVCSVWELPGRSFCAIYARDIPSAIHSKRKEESVEPGPISAAEVAAFRHQNRSRQCASCGLSDLAPFVWRHIECITRTRAVSISVLSMRRDQVHQSRSMSSSVTSVWKSLDSAKRLPRLVLLELFGDCRLVDGHLVVRSFFAETLQDAKSAKPCSLLCLARLRPWRLRKRARLAQQSMCKRVRSASLQRWGSNERDHPNGGLDCPNLLLGCSH
jgi:hypothetical protein